MKQILTNQDINTVIICTTPDTHKEIIIEMIKSNKKYFLEKPITKTLDEAYEIKKELLKIMLIFIVGLIIGTILQ